MNGNSSGDWEKEFIRFDDTSPTWETEAGVVECDPFLPCPDTFGDLSTCIGDDYFDYGDGYVDGYGDGNGDGYGHRFRNACNCIISRDTISTGGMPNSDQTIVVSRSQATDTPRQQGLNDYAPEGMWNLATLSDSPMPLPSGHLECTCSAEIKDLKEALAAVQSELRQRSEFDKSMSRLVTELEAGIKILHKEYAQKIEELRVQIGSLELRIQS